MLHPAQLWKDPWTKLLAVVSPIHLTIQLGHRFANPDAIWLQFQTKQARKKLHGFTMRNIRYFNRNSMLACLKVSPIKDQHIQLGAESALHTSVWPRLTSTLQMLLSSPQISLSPLHLNVYSCGHQGFPQTQRFHSLLILSVFLSWKSLTCLDIDRERGMRSLIRVWSQGAGCWSDAV